MENELKVIVEREISWGDEDLGRIVDEVKKATIEKGCDCTLIIKSIS